MGSDEFRREEKDMPPRIYQVKFRGFPPFHPERLLSWDADAGLLLLLATDDELQTSLQMRRQEGAIPHFLGKADDGSFHLLLLEAQGGADGPPSLVGKVRATEYTDEGGVWGAEAGGGTGGEGAGGRW
jgi:hypothetical protein